MHRTHIDAQAKSRKKYTSNSVTLEDKAAQHIGSCSPATPGMVEFQLQAVFLVIFTFDIHRKPNGGHATHRLHKDQIGMR